VKTIGLAALVVASLLMLSGLVDPALAQRHPFAVSGAEGGGAGSAVGGLAGLILAWQARFHGELQAAARALRTNPSALVTLVSASFAYGVFHAAGPGHGKAVLASYMLASKTELKRGLVLVALAAMLQGLVAIALVGVAALVFEATAEQMTDATRMIEIVSYAAIAALGLRLTWVKGRAFFVSLRAGPVAPTPSGRFACDAIDDPAHIHDADCGHFHAPDPATLSDRRFRWGDAIATVVAAGMRPCSGAILALVFTLSQDYFTAGVLAVMAMAAGTAVTTGAIAAFAVFARDRALRPGRPGSRRARLIAQGAEFTAAIVILLLGASLLAGAGLASRGGA
jgi:nickel/cobalt exporter